MNRELQSYVEWAGGIALAAKRLGLTVGAVSHYCRGRRRVSPEIAMRMEQDSCGLFKKEKLVWPEDHE